LEQLSGVKVKREFVVFTGWPVTEVEQSLETDFGMKVLGKERVEKWWEDVP
jgi:hypothetical protein